MWGFPVCWQTSTTIERKVWKVDAPGDLSGSYYTERKTWTGSLKKDGNYVLEPGSVEIWIYYLWYKGQCYRGPRGGSMAEVVGAKLGLEDVDNTIVMIGGWGVLSIMWRIYLMWYSGKLWRKENRWPESCGIWRRGCKTNASPNQEGEGW